MKVIENCEEISWQATSALLVDYVTVTKPMAHIKLGIIQAVF